MNILPTVFRRYLVLATLPAAALAFSGCGDDDDDGPGQGRVRVVHAAPNANVPVKVLVNTSEVGQVTYGQSTNYLNVDAGSRTFTVNVAQTGSTAFSVDQSVTANRNYTLFAYNASATTNPLASPLWIEDDLTAPTAGKVKIRLVHLALGAASPVRLAKANVSGAVTNLSSDVAFGAASTFTEVDAGDASMYLASANAPLPVTLNKNLTAGKIYTIVATGSAAALTTDTQVKLIAIDNN